MAWQIKVTCEVCGIERKDTNHWFSFAVDSHRQLQCEPLNMDELHGRPETVIDVCGQVCAHKVFDMYLSRGHIDMKAPHVQAWVNKGHITPTSEVLESQKNIERFFTKPFENTQPVNHEDLLKGIKEDDFPF